VSFGFYGFEAMALILDAIASAGADRSAVAATAWATRDRTRSWVATRSTPTG
jgi:hypothetical protein